jgi:hypothetical protein
LSASLRYPPLLLRSQILTSADSTSVRSVQLNLNPPGRWADEVD